MVKQKTSKDWNPEVRLFTKDGKQVKPEEIELPAEVQLFLFETTVKKQGMKI